MSRESRALERSSSASLGGGEDDLPDEQGIANAPAETSSDPKIATGPAESDPDESCSGPKTATDLAEIPSEGERDVTNSGQKTAIGPAVTTRRRTANETSPVDDALDCLTASGKRSESEGDETASGKRSESEGDRERALRSFLVPRSEDW